MEEKRPITGLALEDESYLRGYSDAFKRHREMAKQIMLAISIVPPTLDALQCCCNDCWDKVNTYRAQVEQIAALLSKDRENVVAMFEKAGYSI